MIEIPKSDIKAGLGPTWCGPMAKWVGLIAYKWEATKKLKLGGNRKLKVLFPLLINLLLYMYFLEFAKIFLSPMQIFKVFGWKKVVSTLIPFVTMPVRCVTLFFLGNPTKMKFLLKILCTNIREGRPTSFFPSHCWETWPAGQFKVSKVLVKLPGKAKHICLFYLSKKACKSKNAGVSHAHTNL